MATLLAGLNRSRNCPVPLDNSSGVPTGRVYSSRHSAASWVGPVTKLGRWTFWRYQIDSNCMPGWTKYFFLQDCCTNEWHGHQEQRKTCWPTRRCLPALQLHLQLQSFLYILGPQVWFTGDWKGVVKAKPAEFRYGGHSGCDPLFFFQGRGMQQNFVVVIWKVGRFFNDLGTSMTSSAFGSCPPGVCHFWLISGAFLRCSMKAMWLGLNMLDWFQDDWIGSNADLFYPVFGSISWACWMPWNLIQPLRPSLEDIAHELWCFLHGEGRIFLPQWSLVCSLALSDTSLSMFDWIL